MRWHGVMPAVTTPFLPDLSIDFELLGRHLNWLIRSGATGIVALGSLGEGATLTPDEKRRVLGACREAIAGRVPLVAGVAALSTSEAVELARDSERLGCSGLMVLPPYVYRGDWRENQAHFGAVIGTTGLSCMLYNNPIAYGTDVLPEQVALLAEAHPNLHAVKESSGDVRRVTAIRALLGDRLALLVGLDDAILEGVAAGAAGWIAGLVNGLPEESARLFELARSGRWAEAYRLYDWFLPLLRLDTLPKFVQLIKLVQAEAGMGSETVRPPRLPLAGTEREAALSLIRERLGNRPSGS